MPLFIRNDTPLVSVISKAVKFKERGYLYVIIVITILVLVMSNCFVIIWTIQIDLGNETIPVPVRRVNKKEFKLIAKGMTKREVKTLCGDPGYIYTKSNNHSKLIGMKSKDGCVKVYCVGMFIDMWEYNWTYHVSGCCPFSYAVFFDENGKVIGKTFPEKKLQYCYWLYRYSVSAGRN